MAAPLYSDIAFSVSIVANEIVTDADAINQNIAMIFDTPLQSKWFRPKNGSNINQWLFDPIDDITSGHLQRDMEMSLAANDELRVVFNNVEVVPDPANQQYYVEISYNAPELEKQNQVFRFNLTRGLPV